MTTVVPVTMRRSARQTKQAELFSPSKTMREEKERRKSSVSVISSSRNTDSDEDENSDDSESSPKRANKRNVQQKRKAATLPPSDGNKENKSRKLFASNLLFASLSKPRADDTVDMWINMFKSDRVGAMADLVNFVLMCAGSTKDWIKRDLDLEALDAEEIDEVLTNMITQMQEAENSDKYPIGIHSKDSKALRQKFTRFWTTLTVRIIAKLDDAQGLNAVDTLRVIVDQLVSISSIVVVNVRDVVTEAAMTIGHEIAVALADLRSKIQIANRQLNAESSKASSKTSKKSLAVSKEKDISDKLLTSLTALLENIFKSIFLHRYKDFQPELRADCASNFGDWITADPTFFHDDDYLKYLGALMADREAIVRRQAVTSIIKVIAADQTESDAVAAFVQHFIDDFIKVSVGDVDEAVQFDMLAALRVMQSKGLIDFVHENQLDSIDQIVFDEQSTLKVRQEALLFMMDHTHGFQEEDEEDHTVITKNKQKSSEIHTSSLTHRRKMAMQLETLVEFIEHHDAAQGVSLITEACLSLDKMKNVLKDWSTMITLLLREGDELTTTSLTDSQCSLLLRMLTCSALTLKKSKEEASTTDKVGKGQKRSIVSKDDEALESLSEQLVKSLSSLLVRFRDDQTNVTEITRLLPCCDISSSSLDQKQMRIILGTVSNLLISTRNEFLLAELCVALRHWVKLGGSSKGQVESTIRELLSSCRRKIEDTLKFIRECSTSKNLTSSSKSSKKGSKVSDGSSNDLHDALCGLSSSVTLSMHLWRNIDCRVMVKEELTNLSEQIVEVSDILLEHCEILSNDGARSKTVLQACSAGLENTAKLLYNFCCWSWREAQLQCTEYKEREPPVAVTDTIFIRDQLVDVIHTWLSLGVNSADGPTDLFNDFKLSLQRTAFEIVGDMRIIFSNVYRGYLFLESLVWSPSIEFLDNLRMVFESQERRIRDQLNDLADIEGTPDDEMPGSSSSANKKDVNKLCELLIGCFLNPVCQVMVYDFNNLNRRQAAAVLIHFTDKFDSLKHYVKLWSQRLKERAFVKYLEVQLVTLKMSFEDGLLKTASQLIEDEDRDDEDAKATLADELENTYQLAQRLNQSLGLAKLKDEEKIDALGKLFVLGIEYAFSDCVSPHLYFLRVLTPYFTKLEKRYFRSISQFFEKHLVESGIDIDDDSAATDRFELNSVFQILKEFKNTLEGEKVAKWVKNRRKPVANKSSNVSVSNLSEPIARNLSKKGLKTLEELDFEATQESVQFDVSKQFTRKSSRKSSETLEELDVEVTQESVQSDVSNQFTRKSSQRSLQSQQNKPAVGLHLEDIGDDDEYDSEVDLPTPVKPKVIKSAIDSDEELFGRGVQLGKRSTRSSKPSYQAPDGSDSDSADEIATWGTARRRFR